MSSLDPIRPGFSLPGSFHASRPLHFVITRGHIEALELDPVLQLVRSLVATPEAAARNAGRLSLSISGYHKGERGQRANREQLRRYFQALDQEFSGWFHVCNRWDNTLRMLFLAMTPLKEAPDPLTGKLRLTFELSALELFISVHNLALMRLHQENGIPPRTTTHVRQLMQSYFDNYFVLLKQEREIP